MDPKVLYWSAALANLGVVVLLAVGGVRAIRRAEVLRHRRLMLSSIALVLAFLVSYLFKVELLGKEDLAEWSSADIWVLRIHETCVTLMLVAGAIAGGRAFKMRSTRAVTRDAADPPAPDTTRRSHRRWGWTAVIAAILGFATATLVLAAMYTRTA